MSIIGPRASEWDAVNTFLPDEIDKMKVRPGITGLSQGKCRKPERENRRCDRRIL